jgi:cytochrome c
MAVRFPPGSLILTVGLLALGTAGAGVSLGVQRWQTHQHNDTVARALTGGDPQLGKAVFRDHGCGACHTVHGVDGAEGLTGPALDKVAVRAFVAGDQPNDPQHLIAWVQHPQALQPGVGMPEMGLTDAQARDVAAFLYTLR